MIHANMATLRERQINAVSYSILQSLKKTKVLESKEYMHLSTKRHLHLRKNNHV